MHLKNIFDITPLAPFSAGWIIEWCSEATISKAVSASNWKSIRPKTTFSCVNFSSCCCFLCSRLFTITFELIQFSSSLFFAIVRCRSFSTGSVLFLSSSVGFFYFGRNRDTVIKSLPTVAGNRFPFIKFTNFTIQCTIEQHTRAHSTI